MDASIRRALRTLERSEVTISVHVPVLINYESPAESELFDAYLDYDQAMARVYEEARTRIQFFYGHRPRPTRFEEEVVDRGGGTGEVNAFLQDVGVLREHEGYFDIYMLDLVT